MNASAGGHYQREQNLIGPRGVGQADLHGVKMTPHVRSVNVRNWHVEPSARAAHFFRRSYDRFCISKNLAHRVAAGHMPQGAVLDLSGGADNRSLTKPFDDFGISA